MTQNDTQAKVIYINGSVLRAEHAAGLQVREMVTVGEKNLIGEVISVEGDIATLQVFEETSGLRWGAAVHLSLIHIYSVSGAHYLEFPLYRFPYGKREPLFRRDLHRSGYPGHCLGKVRLPHRGYGRLLRREENRSGRPARLH